MAEQTGSLEVEAGRLVAYVRRLLEAKGAPAAKAAAVARLLVDADLCGHSSHGVRLLPHYVAQISRGEIDVHADPVADRDGGGLINVDGRFGFGHLIAQQATDLAVERARDSGAAVVAVRNANHIGRLGAYTGSAAERGCAALLFVNAQGTRHVQVAPFGAVEARLTNNPISLAVPGGLVVDMALSHVAESRVLQAHAAGSSVPDGWILDREGSPTTDPGEYAGGGSLVPLGGKDFGYKGYGMIMLVEAIVGLLAGGGMAGDGSARFSNAFVLVCVDPGAESRSRFLDDVEHLIEFVKSSKPRDGVSEILVPGEPEARSLAQARSVTLDALTVKALDELGGSLGVAAGW